MGKVLLLEPFCGDSHKLLVEFLEEKFKTVTFALPAQKWHWRARTAALYLAQIIPNNEEMQCRTLFASSVLNLAELVALRPDLGRMKKVLYFHENQLVYPVRKQQERDFQNGYNQILSSLVADVVIFNSNYNMSSFLSSISSFLNLIPDHKPQNITEQIQPKCQVIYLPLPVITFPYGPTPASSPSRDEMMRPSHLVEEKTDTIRAAESPNNLWLEGVETSVGYNTESNKSQNICVIKSVHSDLDDSMNKLHEEFPSKVWKANNISQESCDQEDQQASLSRAENVLKDETHFGDGQTQRADLDLRKNVLHIVWPHRWEHDKNPEMFFSVLLKLQEEGYDFRISVLGGQFSKVPVIFDEAKDQLASKIAHWGYQPSKESYYSILKESDVVVSTANHEFLGIAMLEAAFLMCHPLCPNRLAYPEIFPKTCLYNTQQQLFKKLREFCKKPWLAKENFPNIDFSLFSQEVLLPKYEQAIDDNPKF